MEKLKLEESEKLFNEAKNVIYLGDIYGLEYTAK